MHVRVTHQKSYEAFTNNLLNPLSRFSTVWSVRKIRWLVDGTYYWYQVPLHPQRYFCDGQSYQEGRQQFAETQHPVTVGNFWLAETEVTQAWYS